MSNSCDVETGVMLRLKVVKTPEELRRTEDHSGEHAHGTQVTLDLLSPWSGTRTERVVLGDSYFASLKTCRALKAVNLRFIGPVKSCHAGFPQAYFNNLRMNNRERRRLREKDRLIRGVIIERDNYEKQASSPENKE